MEKTNPKIEAEWLEVLKEEFAKPYFDELKAFLLDEKRLFGIYPPGNRIFAAFDHTPFSKVKVVILGQDPYHGPGQAHGLCFSVPDGIAIPPSLLNIFKEIHSDTGRVIPTSGDLTRWAAQGVLLLNATLTVRAHEAGAHQGKGWEVFTDRVIQLLNDKRENLVFVLWGNYAQKKGVILDAKKHLVLKSVHPSPLSASRGFLGCGHFSKINEYLISKGQTPIDWQLPSEST